MAEWRWPPIRSRWGRTGRSSPSFDTALRKLIQNLEDFDADSIRRDEVARAGAMVAAAAKG